MITKNEFFDFIASVKKFESSIERLEEAITGRKYGCIFESDWYESVGNMIDTFFDSHFTETGIDLVYWWMYEDVDHIIYQDIDKNLFEEAEEKEYDVNDLEDFWNFLNRSKETYFKNV